jgi:hypothetical protein
MRARVAIAVAVAALAGSAGAHAGAPDRGHLPQATEADFETAQGIEALWNAAAGALRVVEARCRHSANGRYYCHLELRPAAVLTSARAERCLYMEFQPPFTWLRAIRTVCDDGGGGTFSFEPLPRP